MKCAWCGAPLTFVAAKGWLHPNGELYVSHQERRPCLACGGRRTANAATDMGGDGCARCLHTGMVYVTVDDHCALAVPDDAPPPRVTL